MLSEAEAEKRVSEWVKQSKTLRIFIFGKVGAGKSTLVNSLLNKEVAEVGPGLGAVTQETKDYGGRIAKVPFRHMTIYDIDVTLWDTPGLQDPMVDKESLLKDITASISGNVDLYVYCIQMTQTRAEQGDVDAIADLTKSLGVDFWKRTFFALTFANEVTVPLSCSNITLEDYFEQRVGEWTTFLRSAVLTAGVDQLDVKKIPIVPTGYKDGPVRGLRSTGRRWFATFWSTCLVRMRFLSIPALLTVNQEEWANNEASDVIAARVISQRLMTLGDQIQVEHQIEQSLFEIPTEDMWRYLKQAILDTGRNRDDDDGLGQHYPSDVIDGPAAENGGGRSSRNTFVTISIVTAVVVLGAFAYSAWRRNK